MLLTTATKRGHIKFEPTDARPSYVNPIESRSGQVGYIEKQNNNVVNCVGATTANNTSHTGTQW